MLCARKTLLPFRFRTEKNSYFEKELLLHSMSVRLDRACCSSDVYKTTVLTIVGQINIGIRFDPCPIRLYSSRPLSPQCDIQIHNWSENRIITKTLRADTNMILCPMCMPIGLCPICCTRPPLRGRLHVRFCMQIGNTSDFM
jgi:hypothetical protein